MLGTATLWPLLLGITVLPALLQLVLLPLCPESPRYLYISRNLEGPARKSEPGPHLARPPSQAPPQVPLPALPGALPAPLPARPPSQAPPSSPPGLKRLTGWADVSGALAELKEEKRKLERERPLSLLQLLGSRTHRQPLAIAVVLQLSQQLSGINAVR